MLKNDIFGPQNDHFGSFFKVFSLFQNFNFEHPKHHVVNIIQITRLFKGNCIQEDSNTVKY